jgi:hypothetical protein
MECGSLLPLFVIKPVAWSGGTTAGAMRPHSSAAVFVERGRNARHCVPVVGNSQLQ